MAQHILDGHKGVRIAHLAIRFGSDLPEPPDGSLESLPGDRLSLALGPHEMLLWGSGRNDDVKHRGPGGDVFANPLNQMFTAQGLVGDDEVAAHAFTSSGYLDHRSLPIPSRLLLEGRPGVGKTTVARRLVGLLQARGVAVTGFTTEEIRRGRRREGFAVETLGGQRETLAHVELPGPPRVGRYGVDLAAFERVVLPVLEEVRESRVVVIDELGKMELASAPFRTAVGRLFGEEVSLVATVHVFKHDFTDAVKRRRDVEVVKVSASNRDALPEAIVPRLIQR